MAGAFFATFFAGAFLGAAFFAGAFFAGMSYPPFHSAVAEDKTQITIGLTNEHSLHRQSEIVTTLIFRRSQNHFFRFHVPMIESDFPVPEIVSLSFPVIIFCGSACDRKNIQAANMACHWFSR